MRRSVLRLVATLILTLQLGACVSWSAVSTPPETFIADDAPERVRVTRMDGVQLTLERPELRAGAIVATASPGAVLLDDVRQMEVEKISLLRSIGIMIPSALLVVVAANVACGDRC